MTLLISLDEEKSTANIGKEIDTVFFWMKNVFVYKIDIKMQNNVSVWHHAILIDNLEQWNHNQNFFHVLFDANRKLICFLVKVVMIWRSWSISQNIKFAADVIISI